MITGLKYPVCAPYSVGAGNVPTYGEGFVMGKGVKITPTTENADAEFWADNELYASDNGITGGTISEEISHMTPENYAKLLGHTYKAKSENSPEEVEIKAGDTAIEVGHGYIVLEEYKDNKEQPVYKHVVVWYNRVKFTEPNNSEGQTRAKNTEYTAITIDGRWSAACNGAFGKKIYCESEAEAISTLNELANINPAAAAN